MSQPPQDPYGSTGADPDRPPQPGVPPQPGSPYGGQPPGPPPGPGDGPGSGSTPPAGGGGFGGFFGGEGGGGAGGAGGDNPVGGFFTALADLTFRRYVTPYIVKFVYLLAIALGVIWWLVALTLGFIQEPLVGVLVLFLGPVALVLWIALLRMTLEFYHAVTTMSLHIRGLDPDDGR